MARGQSRGGRASAMRITGAWFASVAMVISVLTGSPAHAEGVATAVESPVATNELVARASVVDAAPGEPLPTANLALFQAGNIISDAVFFDRGTMTEAQIQSFLQAKVPSCQSGYTCLKDWYDTSRTTTADAMCGAYSGGTRERASRIIYKVAQACGINPQVLLVTLQKEQGLVTHVWPSDWRYTLAMGQGCPDTAACDARYHGFFNQVYGAAWQMKRYANPPGTSQYFTWYAPGKTWNVRYHPNVSCGTSPVLIQNQATANLYYYTPYQPNAAALRAGYGEGDGCSAYGNRNFYNYFNDWFGATAPGSIATVDTVPHLLALEGAGELWAYPADGKTGWLSRASLGTGLRGASRIIAPGDLDGDGRRDVLSVDVAGAVWLHRGNGALGLHDPVPLAVNWSAVTNAVAAGDFSGDGVPDVFTTDAAGVLHLWRGTNGAGFRAPIAVGSGWNVMNMLISAGDFSGDGYADLLARRTDGALMLYLGNGRGGWKGVQQIGSGWGGMRTISVPGDFGADGTADILASDAAGNLWLYAGVGGGSLRALGKVGSGWNSFTSVIGPGPAATGVRVVQPGAGDVDGDLIRDVLAVTAAGTVMVYRGNGVGGWAGVVQTGQVWAAEARTMTLGDFNGDGVPDVGRITADGLLWLVPGDGRGGFSAPVAIGNGWGVMDAVVGGVDFDGDRRMDVLARDADGNLRLYRGDGAGRWMTGTGGVIGTGWGAMNAIFSAGDFDGDRRPDILARRTDGALMLYSGNGTGGWSGVRQVGKGWGAMTALFSPGDFDGNGGTDVIARRPDGTLWLYAGDGKGGWSTIRQIGKGWGGMTWIG